MQISPHCFAVTGLGYVLPWCVNAGFIVGQHTTLVVDTGANALAAATIHGPPTNVSVYVPQDGALFCGDCLVNGYLPNLDCGTTVDWQEWLVSLDRIARLGPSVVVPGHGPARSFQRSAFSTQRSAGRLLS